MKSEVIIKGRKWPLPLEFILKKYLNLFSKPGRNSPRLSRLHNSTGGKENEHI